MSRSFELFQPKKKINRRHFSRLFGKILASGGILFLPNPVSAAQATGGNPTELALAGQEKEKEKRGMVFKTYVLPGDRFFPESIGYQPATGYFFVGSLENGQVVRGNVKTGEVGPFLASGVNGMTSAAGIKLDREHHLFVAGGYSGKIFIYQASTAKLLASFQVEANQTVVNDFVCLPNGEVYVTDSLNPYIYKISADRPGNFRFDAQWLALGGSVINYQSGLNLNGITASADGRYLIVGQTNTGQLFRIELATKKIDEIDLKGENLLHADGILLDGHQLYVAQNAFNLITTVHLSHDYLRGKIVARTTDPAFQFPTALAKAGEQLLIVNGQLDKEGPGLSPVLPFKIVAIPVPEKSGHDD